MSRLSVCLIVGSVFLTGACTEAQTGAIQDPFGGAGGVAGTQGSGDPFWDAGLAGVGAWEQAYRRMDVSVEQGITGRGAPFSRMIVSLSDNELPGFPEVQVIDNCEVTDLRDFSGYPTWAPTAGVITIEQEAARDIVIWPLQLPGLRPVPFLYVFSAPSGDVPRWAPGDELFIYADGDEIQSFRSILVFPEMVEARRIVNREAQNRLPTIHRDKDLRLFWSPIEEPVGVSIIQYRADVPFLPAYRVRCAFSGDDGFGRITSRALEGLDDDDVLEDETSRTEAYVNGMTIKRVLRDDAEVVITLSHGTGVMLNVK
jgi:hypothetical protein